MSGATILVVEDNALNAKLVRDVLRFSGYDVLEAETGEEGLRVARERLPDLVLMDLQLPGIDGTEALRRLRADAATRHIPVMAVTASAMPADRAEAARAGFDAFLEKPISVRALPERVAALLSDGRGHGD